MSRNNTVEKMWKNYLNQLDSNSDMKNLNYDAWHFCSEKEDADELAELTKQGIKRATTSLHHCYEVDGDELPKVGDLNVITDWEGNAFCIIKTTKVTVIPFKDVSEEFAYREGEGDKSLKYWRDAHIKYFEEWCNEIGIEFNWDMLVVLEEFEKVY